MTKPFDVTLKQIVELSQLESLAGRERDLSLLRYNGLPAICDRPGDPGRVVDSDGAPARRQLQSICNQSP